MEFEGRTEQEAVERASTALSIGRAELDYTVIDEGSGGLFGLGARPVRIRARTAAQQQQQQQRSVSSGPSQPTRGQQSMGETEEGEDVAGGIVGPAPEKAAKALEVAQALAERMKMAANVSVRDEERQIVVVLSEAEGTRDVAEMLGSSRPPGVPSFQFLLNKIVNRFPENRKHIVVEAPSVSERAAERRAQSAQRHAQRPAGTDAPRAPEPLPEDVDPSLAALARSLADRAKELGKVITIHPMSASDRRAIHLTVMTIDGVETVSEGEGLYRRIHVVPGSLKGDGGGARKRRRRRRRRGRREDETPATPNNATEESPSV